MIALLPSFLVVLLTVHEDLELQIERLTRRIEASPADARLFYRRAELHRLHRDGTAARADYERARELDPRLAEVDLGLGRLLREEGRFAEAVRRLDAYVARRPESPSGRLERARAAAALGAWSRAAEDYAAALAALPNPPPDLHVERARVLRSGGSTDEALRALDEAVGRLGPLVTLVAEAVEMEAAAGRPEAALRRIDAVLAGGGRKDRWLLRRGEILLGLGRKEAAREAFAAALREIAALPAARRSARETAALESTLNAHLKSMEESR